MKDTSNPDVTVKITGYQWGWKYDYSADDFGYYSNLSTPWEQIGQPGTPAAAAKEKDYLLEVDNPMVVPVGKRVRLLITSNDVIHGWYVPQVGINQYGIPGFIKDAWFTIEKAGTYRGQCSQICGKEHGFMPIVVVAKPQAEYDAWVKEAKAKMPPLPTAPQEAPAAGAAPPAQVAAADAKKKWTMDELKSAGEKLYAANCAACHQPTGKGVPPAFPALDGSKIATGPKAGHMALVLKGKTGTAMASFAQLADADLAAIITYERNSCGNKTGDAIQPAEIAAARK